MFFNKQLAEANSRETESNLQVNQEGTGMSEAVLAERIREVSPLFKARMAGVCQLLEAITAASGAVLIPGRLVVAGNAAATAANILGHPRLFWLGFSSSVAGVLFHVAWVLLMYVLLKPVNKSLSLFAAWVILVGCAIQAVTCLLYLSPWVILQSGSGFGAFTPDQLQALALVFLGFYNYAFKLFLVFFGIWLIVTGYLIFKSTF